MATTSSWVANKVLSALTEAEIDFAVLHREEELAVGDVGSDVDLVIGLPMAVALRGPFTDRLRQGGIRPVIYWPYDVAGTATVFFTNEDATKGAQIDTLHDPDARGKFGIRSDALLSKSEQGLVWPRTERIPSLLYQLRKRHRKGQHESIQGLREQLREYSVNDIRRTASETFAPRSSDLVLQLVEGTGPTPLPSYLPTNGVRELARKANRLLSPVGAWAEFAGREADTAADIASERFGRLLNVTQRANRPRTGAVRWWLGTVAPVRWRPGLVVGAGAGGYPQPDLFIEIDDAEAAVRQLVQGLSDRVTG
jgi:hypothetical protein